jgi:hypothetical protein
MAYLNLGTHMTAEKQDVRHHTDGSREKNWRSAQHSYVVPLNADTLNI